MAAGEVEGPKVGAGVPDGLHLPVAGGVVLQQDPVVAPADDLPILHHHAAEGPAVAMADALVGLVQSGFHELIHSQSLRSG